MLCAMSAVVLSATMLATVSCTKKMDDQNDTTTGTVTDTTATTKPETNSETAKPMDPDAGTVKPDSDPANPPAGTDTDARYRARFMR